MDTYGKKWSSCFTQILCMLFLICILTFLCATPILAADTTQTNQTNGVGIDEIGDSTTPDNLEFNISSNLGSASLASTLQIVLLLTVLALAPSILIMVTSFIRIIIVLHFTRAALGTQTTPPNQVLIGLALILTFFIMSPTFEEVNNNAIQPLSRGEITQEAAIERGMEPIRNFMFNQIKGNRKDLRLFLDIAGIDTVANYNEIPNTVLIPAFILGELRNAFQIGFIIYIPFIIMDMVVASTLMSMGMMMLPPTVISMPFKILLFIMADGWNLVIGELVKTFFT